ncbi:MAG: PorT family protein [Prevotellaceae bacterium]|jgi:hypothetical protein|nr:PorT family protein [Prevotellaceae bacterium]
MTKSVIKICILLFGILSAISVSAQDAKDSAYIYQGNLGLLIGTDIGGAIPFPVSNIPGTINAYPQINPALGASISFSLIKGWGLGVEVNYKTVAMKADARVSNQQFNMDDDRMYFTGTTKTDMKFTMLEVPLYTKYRFDNRNFAFAGLYYSHIFSGNFVADPVKGYSGSEPDVVEITDVSDITMDFSQYLDDWDLGALVGYERAVFDRLKLALRFSMGFKDIFKAPNNYFDYSMLHARGCITLTYDLISTKRLFKVKH